MSTNMFDRHSIFSEHNDREQAGIDLNSNIDKNIEERKSISREMRTDEWETTLKYHWSYRYSQKKLLWLFIWIRQHSSMFSPTGTTFHCPKMSFERVPNPFQTHENFICERRIRLSIRVWSCLFVCQYQGALLPSVVLIEDEKNSSMFFLSFSDQLSSLLSIMYDYFAENDSECLETNDHWLDLQR